MRGAQDSSGAAACVCVFVLTWVVNIVAGSLLGLGVVFFQLVLS